MVSVKRNKARQDRRFRIRQFKSCWGLQSSPWWASIWPRVTGAEKYTIKQGTARGNFKEVSLRMGSVLAAEMGWVHTGECILSLGRAVSHQSARPQVSQHQRYRKRIHLWIWNAKKYEIHHFSFLDGQATG